jgi:hypothetical protein
MEIKEVKRLLQRYFEGASTTEEERALESYFRSGSVAEELREYTGFFTGISELSGSEREDRLEEEIMDFLLEHESGEKTKYRGMWQMVTGIAASVIIVIGGLLLYQQRDQQFEDTFDDPQVAYAYAAQTLEYMAAQYNKGLKPLENFDRLETAARPLHTAAKPVNEYMKMIEEFKRND